MTARHCILLLSIFSLFSPYIFSQVDNEFWIAPPSATFYNVGDEDDIELVITAMQATVVTLEQPATGWSYTTPTIGAFGSLILNVANDLGLNMNNIETPPSPIGSPYNNGFKITSSPGLITVSYKLTNDKSQDQISCKGKNALGTEFFVSTQNAWNNQNNNYYSGFSIVATQDNTTIEIERNNVWTGFPGPFPTTETLILNEGQTYTILSLDNTIANHINGVKVTSDKNIAITYWDDQVAKNLTNQNNFKYDFAGDQLVPTSIIGTEYIVMKGGMGYVAPPGDGGERIFVTGTVDGTVVNIYDFTGALQSSFVVNAGEVINREVTLETNYVRTSEPIYINHYTSVTNGQAVSVAVLPPVGPCTGSHDVVITRSPHASDEFILNILAVNDTLEGSTYKNLASGNFYITTSRGVTQIPSSYFLYNDDSSYIALDKVQFQVDFLGNNPVIDIGETALIQNRVAKFHLGIVEGHKNSGAKFGYFSDYGGQSAHSGIGGPDEDALHVQCSVNPVRLAVTGGRTYQWWVEGVDSANSLNFLSALDVSEPIYYPDTFGVKIFKIRATQLCGGLYENTLVVHTVPQPRAYFAVETEEVCSPDSILITHGVTLGNVNMDWYFNKSILPGLSENSTTATPYYHVLPNNNSDTTYTYQIDLQTNYLGACSDIYSRTITVKPAISSEFEFIGDSIACHPLNVILKNTSTGNVDSTSFLWDFGDLTISYEVDSVRHTFNNYSLSDTSYTISLITRSPFDCLDSSFAQVSVYPRVKALFSTTPNQGCSPLKVDINPVNSYGADSLFWHIDFHYDDSSFTYTNLKSFNIVHEDSTVLQGSDTINVQLVAENKYGCSDTALPHQILVYPASTADFDISSDVICDSDTITFQNYSIGYNVDFFWNLGDGTAPNDTSPTPKPYYNPSTVDLYYLISLSTVSEHNCVDYKDTVLTVHPYLNANFGINYVKNCSPLQVKVTNNSAGAQIYNWEMGDGSSFTYTNDFNHTYINPSANIDTTYLIQLFTENIQGCVDSISRLLTVKPQVVALMDLEDKTGCSPLTTSFNNYSSGGSYYVWELGGANIRTDTNVVNFTQTYTNETANDISYLIRLTARNDAGCDSSVIDTVDVFANIFASFSFNKDSSCSPFTPSVINNSSSGAKVFEWYRNSSFISSAKSPVLTEKVNTGNAPDYYYYTLISLGANDLEHRVCADTHTLRLAIFPSLAASFKLDETASCQPISTPVTNTSYPTDSVSYIWYLDNYVYSNQKDPGLLVKENYTDMDQVHSLRLSGKTVHGCADEDTIDFTVFAYIDANFNIDRPAICSGLPFNINRGNTRGNIDTYEWDFDGVTENRTDVQFSYIYDNTGPFPVDKPTTLRVSNANCDSTWRDTIQIYPLVTSGIDLPVNAGCHPFTASFVNTSTNADIYKWSFGDGVSSNDPNPIHTYRNYDPENDLAFDVQLIAESEYKCADTSNVQATALARPNANFFLPKSVSCPPFDFSVINSSEGAGLDWDWTLGSAGSFNDFEPITEFDNQSRIPAYEPIKLKVTSKNGCKDSISREITIYPHVNVGFTASPWSGCSPLIVEFSGDTTNVQQMVWYIDDYLFSTQISPANIFLNEDNKNIEHNIKIIAYSRYNCIDSSENVITVYPTPSADFIAAPIPAQYGISNDATSIGFVNLSNFQNSWDYEWDFGDGNVNRKTESNFNYTYGSHFWGDINNNYKIPVRLVASNKDNSSCKDTIMRNIMILPPVPVIDIGDDVEGCKPLEVDFSAYTKYAYENSYEWNFGDGTAVVHEASPTHIFDQPGTYTVRLNVMGDGGLAADYKMITVFDQPEANFSFNDSIVMIASLTSETDIVNFYNQSKNALKFAWFFDSIDFIDNKEPNSTEKDPTWAYQEVGEYRPVLIAHSNEGCADTLVHPKTILVKGEGIIEFPSGFFVHPSQPPSDEYAIDQSAGNLYLFYPKNSGVHEYKLEIYNKWGTKVFTSNDVNRGWNGYIEGVPAKQDVYVWRARGRFTNGVPFDLSGDVTLIIAPVNVTF